MARIGLDFDGVITNCGKLKALSAKKLFGIDIPEGSFKKEIVIGGGLLNPEQYKQVQLYAYGNTEMGRHMEELPDATNSIRSLQKEHEVVIITARTKEFAEIAQQWLRSHNLSLEMREVSYEKTKKEDATDVDIFVDDDIQNLTDLIGHVPHLFLFDWPYNKTETLPPEIERVADWNTLVQKINRILS